MTTSSVESTKVFISYTHDSPEHMDRVLELSDRLRAEGVDCHLDQYETSPPEGWPKWTNRQIDAAAYVLIVCTETYLKRFNGTEEKGKGLGAQWEGGIITQELYDSAGDNRKFVPVLFSPEDSGNIPRVLRGVQSYDVSSEAGYTELYRRLTNRPRVVKPDIGSLRSLPTRERKQFFLTSSWNVPYTPNPFFTGREEALTQLHEALHTKGTAAVSGMPGVGKTQTAVEYAHRHRSEYKYIFWARAETRETLISDYVNVAGILQLPEVRAQEQNLAVGALKRWFDANPDWLLVLDNADDLTLVREYLPTTPKGHIILTRRAQATGAIAAPVNVKEMEESEGALFLLRRARLVSEDATLEDATEEDRDKAQEITREVDGLPLALDQAGAFIEESSSSSAEYLELYRTQGADLRKRRGEHVLGHPESVEITFSLSFAKVEAASPTAADLLRACAFLAPDAIPEEIFTEGGTHLGDSLAATVNNRLAFLDTVRETLRYSLLRRDPDQHTLSIHRVVQDVLKDTMDEATQRQWAERVIRAVNQILPPDFDESDFADWHRYENLLPHAQACARHVERWGLMIPEAAQLLNNLARYLHHRAVLTEVEPLYLQSFAIRQKIYEEDNLDVATSLHNLGWLKKDQTKYAESESLFLQALNIRKRKLGDYATDVAQSLKELGRLKNEQGKYVEAKRYLNQAIDSLRGMPNPNNKILAEVLMRAGNVLIAQGKYSDAEEILFRSLELYDKECGVENIYGAHVRSLLGQVYISQKQYLTAEEHLFRARIQFATAYGADHYYVAQVLRTLGDVHLAQNKPSQSEEYLRQALAIVEKVYGKEHPQIAAIVNSLAMTKELQGNFTEAENLYHRACEIEEKMLGGEHPDLGTGLGNLAALYTKCHRYSEADALFKRAIAIQKKSLSPEHPTLQLVLSKYADLLRKMNRKDEAHRLLARPKKERSKQRPKKPKR